MDLLALATTLQDRIQEEAESQTATIVAFGAREAAYRDGVGAAMTLVRQQAVIGQQDGEDIHADMSWFGEIVNETNSDLRWVHSVVGTVAPKEGSLPDRWIWGPHRTADKGRPIFEVALSPDEEPVRRESLWTVINGLAGSYSASGYHLGKGGRRRVMRQVEAASSVEDVVVRLETLRTKGRDEKKRANVDKRTFDSFVSSAEDRLSDVLEHLGKKTPEDEDVVTEMVESILEKAIELADAFGVEIPQE